jgi:bifunctional enzyme CysN/CysC
MNKEKLIKEDIFKYLKHHENKELLRFITCGSVDDGKSTLIGRLLYETKMVFKDQLMALKAEAKYKRTEEEIDFSLLVDGLQAEREQGITIDVAYRYFSTDKRKFIIADTPGHEQYTRNMATGASNAELAVILIDARNGVLTQTKRHTFIVTLLGIRHIIVAINKMDLINYKKDTYEQIKSDYIKFINELKNKDYLALNTQNLSLENIYFVPISALKGDNIVKKSNNMSWYLGKTVLEFLNTITPTLNTHSMPNNLNDNFRFPVQYINRPDPTFRGYCGTITSGIIKTGDKITVLPSKTETKIKAIIPPVHYETGIKNSKFAYAPMTVTLITEDEIDISRGDLIVKSDNIPDMNDCFEVFVVWMGEEPLVTDKIYNIKRATTFLTGYFEEILFKVNINTLEQEKTDSLNLNEIGYCKINLSRIIAFDPYLLHRQTGSFIIIDRITNNTVGAGMILKKSVSRNVIWHKTKISKQDRVKIKGHKPCIIWLTGLSGSGKSTIANVLEEKLVRMGLHTYLLDGDNIRHGLNKNLGFSKKDREENIRRIAEVSKLFVDAGLIVVTCFISPFKKDREFARSLVEKDEFIEIFIDAPVEVCEKRDPKGLYKKARQGIISEFTGITSPYETPDAPDIHIKTDMLSIEESVEKILTYLRQNNII